MLLKFCHPDLNSSVADDLALAGLATAVKTSRRSPVSVFVLETSLQVSLLASPVLSPQLAWIRT